MKTHKQFQMTTCLVLALAGFSSSALAVGNGVRFGVNEGTVPGSNNHVFQADSVDLSYHACTTITPSAAGVAQQIYEKGYFWLSSYQDDTGVLDSQLNDYQANGYHIYGVYRFDGDEVAQGVSSLGNRRGYELKNASLILYLDPNKDTDIVNVSCGLIFNNSGDDRVIGSGNSLQVGEKSEKDGLANGDFQFVLDDWVWSNSFPIVPFSPMSRVTINANLTLLGGASVDQDHEPEGSGNIYWRND